MATAREVSEIHVTDPTYAPRDDYNALDRWLLGLIKDPRDLPFAQLILQMLVIQLPFAIALLFFDPLPWYLGVGYLAVQMLVFLDKFILMLHCTSHRRLFGRDHAWMNQIIPWVLGPLYGETPETYRGHHMGMHHPENNLPEDLSSTMRFQRDSFIHWLRYFGRFITVGLFELAAYLKRKKRKQLFVRTLIGEGSWYLAVIALMFVNWGATLVVLVIPMVLSRMLMMAGNWGQHAFIDGDRPDNPYVNSITCINTRYNRRCFNDGYHIGHHVKANRHWTELPTDFVDNRERYHKEGAIVFEGVDFFQVWLMLMLKQYKGLAKRYVYLGEGERPSDEEIIALFKERLRAIPV